MKSKIDRKNRDRKGGHECTTYKGYLASAPNGAAAWKKIVKRKARRQNNAAVEQALIVWETEIAQDCYQAMLDDLTINDYTYFADGNPEYDDDENYRNSDYDYYDYGANDYWERDWDYNYLHGGGRNTNTHEAQIIKDLAKPLDFVRISSQHLGETLGTLLRIYM